MHQYPWPFANKKAFDPCRIEGFRGEREKPMPSFVEDKVDQFRILDEAVLHVHGVDADLIGAMRLQFVP